MAQNSDSGQVLAPYKWKSQKRDTVQDRLVLYYYLKQRLLVGDYLVGRELSEWLECGTPLWYLETLVGDADGTPPRFGGPSYTRPAGKGAYNDGLAELVPPDVRGKAEGRWKSTKARNPDQVAEVLDLTVVPASSQFRMELQEDGAASSIRCSEATLSHPRKLSFTAQDDDTTATAECVLSLDGRRMRLVFKPHGWSEQTMILDRVAE